jgi:hypothetical protein
VARTVSAGGVISLRIQFKDDLSKPSEAQNTKVFIFAPGVDTSDNANAVDPIGFTPIYLGEGVYEYQYTTACTPVGEWSEKWVGDLPCQTGLATTLTFSVTAGASEVVSFDGPQLFNNNLVTVTLLPGIASTDGEVFTEAVELEFFTTLSPYYTSTTKVSLEVGSLIAEIKDLTSAMAILESSIEADALTFSPTEINSELFKHARREYVTASASFRLVSNIGGNLLKSKTLGDLSVTYDTNSHRETLEHLQEMMRKWGDQLMAGGGAKEIRNPKMVVKGSRDPDKPTFDRMWEGTGTNKKPIANYSKPTLSGRRSLKTHKKRWW